MQKPPRGRGGRRRQDAAPSAVEADKKKAAEKEKLAKAKQEKAKDAKRVALASGRPLEDQARERTVATSAKRAPAKRAQIDFDDLKGIEVKVAVPPDVGEAEVSARLREKLRELAVVRQLKDGEPLKLGDEALLDLMGYVQGVAMTAQSDVWMRLEPNPLLPRLFEQVADGLVGEHKVLRIVLPADYPDDNRAGQPAAFVIRIKAARRVELPKESDAKVLARLGGKTLADVRKQLRAELTEAQAARMVAEATALVLDEVERRIPLDVPEADIDHELIRQWRVHEGDELARHGVAADEQRAARDAYLANGARRREARRALWSARLFDAIAEERKIRPSLDEVVKFVVQVASASELPVSEIHTALTSSEALLVEMTAKLRQSRALEHLLERAKVRFGA